jgi:DNA modification methylase
MPRISDTIAINNEKLDRRVKLTAEACKINNRKYIGFEIHPDYIEMTKQRLLKYDGGLFSNSFLTESSIETE